MKKKYEQQIEEEEIMLRNKQLFGNNNTIFSQKKNLGFYQKGKVRAKRSDIEEYFDIDTTLISDTLPLLILNPPMGTKLKAGDTILVLGRMDP